MSSHPATQPRMTVVLTAEYIELQEAGAGLPHLRVCLEAPDVEDGLRRLADSARAKGGLVDVILPEAEILRGALDPDAEPRRRAVRQQAAAVLATPEAEIAVTLDRRGEDGATPWAAVPKRVLAETNGFLAECGLVARRISAPGDLPPFQALEQRRGALAPPLRTGRWALLAGTGTAAAALIAVLAWQAADPLPAGMRKPAAIASREAEDAPPNDFAAVKLPEARRAGPLPAHVPAPPARPSDWARASGLRVAAVEAAVAPPVARLLAPAPAPEPAATLSARNMPSALFAPETPGYFAPAPLHSLATGDAALPDPAIPSQLLAELIETLPRSDAAAPAPLRMSARPLRRPAATPAAPAPAADKDAALRPQARPPVSVSPAVISASIATAVAAAQAERADGRPLPRSARSSALAVATASPQPTTFQPQPPTFIRPETVPAGPEPKPATVRAAPPAQPVTATRRTTTTRAAKEQVGLSTREVSLLGVFGSPSEKRALLRLPNGRVERVHAGDRIEEARVVAVGEDSVRLLERGRELVLRLPD